VIVVDASVLATALSDDGSDGERLRLDEALDATLLTADARSTSAPGLRCEVELLR
jgi:hypothetical protein